MVATSAGVIRRGLNAKVLNIRFSSIRYQPGAHEKPSGATLKAVNRA